MKKYLIIFLSIFMFIPKVYAGEMIDVTLSSCVDGDTAVFILNGEKVKFRFLAIDTPESVKTNSPVEFMGKEVSLYTCSTLTNASKIQIMYDDKGTKIDKYGRSLAWIYVDDILLQEDLVSKGYAEVAYVYYKYDFIENLCSRQKEAKNKSLGIWKANRKEGYCKTKSNNKNEKEEKYDYIKIINYIIDGKYDKALKYLFKNTTNVVVLIILLILMIILSIYKIIKKKRR